MVNITSFFGMLSTPYKLMQLLFFFYLNLQLFFPWTSFLSFPVPVWAFNELRAVNNKPH